MVGKLFLPGDNVRRNRKGVHGDGTAGKTPSIAGGGRLLMLAPALVALLVALAASPAAMLLLRRFGILDVPNDRSSHDAPTPRGGGLATAVAVVVAATIAAPLAGHARAALLVAAAGMGLIGLVDDLTRVSAKVRLAAQLLVGALALPWLLMGMTGSSAWRLVFGAGVVAWLVSYVNAFNFMDGIDGMAVGQVVVAGAAWFLVGRHAHAEAFAAGGLIAAAAAAGFAPFNAVRARVFLGDVGSYFLGGALAALAVVGLRAGVTPEAVLAPLTLYLADTGTTLVRRLRRHETWHAAHRDHTYQLLVQGGRSHGWTAGVVAGLIAVCSALGAVSISGRLLLRVAADLLVLVVLASYVTLATRRVFVGGLVSWREDYAPRVDSTTRAPAREPAG